MEAIGCQEMLMPVLQPAQTWEETGRYAIDELFKLEDRREAPMVLALSHEECLTYHMAREIRSYRDLPLMLFHIQTKERDEPRPRAGVLRTREFTMKDAYSFDRDEEGLDRSYGLQSEAYARIFDRCGLRWYRVESDVGMMGGSGAHEYMAPCAAGENEVALAPGYAANVEIASAEPQPVELPAPLAGPRGCRDPGIGDDRRGRAPPRPSRRRPDQGAAGDRRGEGNGDGPDPRRPPPQRDQAGQRARGRVPARRRAEEIEAEIGPVGYIGPVGAKVPIIKDAAIGPGSYVTGANRPDTHLRGVEPGRDFEFEEMDVRTVEAGDTAPGGGTIEIETAIEIGNIFKLGTRYTVPLGANFLDESGTERPIVMGSYGIGPARIVAASIEQRADEQGIVWPQSIAPWRVHLVALGKGGRRGARGRRPHLRRAPGRARAPTSSTTTATPAPARS